ncbi:hypothetical protein [Siphonobacter sp. SORGH_AS_0500]|uniref:hypothetical protein n=1 Tax=Siphonobacter sp. SORGH_AS_0500 TaxID=1864824 RepID=UPI00285D4331|nr:hypothetical protein [Siphonobacter sp. SORGH_AS_0500]MDR6196186.1 hypothetical protein [Siphonobacter sp. SORGH_AS_0500]
MKKLLFLLVLLPTLLKAQYPKTIKTTRDTSKGASVKGRMALNGGWDGTLVGKDVNGKSYIAASAHFESYAQLRSMVALRSGVRYFLDSEGKEGEFRADFSDKTTPDDGGVTLVTVTGIRLKRVISKGSIEVSWYGNTQQALVKALAAAQGKYKVGITGKLTLASSVLLPDNAYLRGDGDSAVIYFSNSALLRPGNRSIIEGLRLTGVDGLNYAIATPTDDVVYDWEIRSCFFDSTFVNPVYIQGTTNNGTHRGKIVNNTFFYPKGNATLIIRLIDSQINGNTVYNRSSSRGLMFFGGKRNEIAYNKIYNGIVGISFAYQKSTAGASGIVEENIIHDNYIRGVTEESISFDGRYNEPANMAAMEYAAITDKSLSGQNKYINLSGNWNATSPNYYNFFVCFTKGALSGECARILAHSNNRMALQLTTAQYKLLQVGDSLAVGAPFLKNKVERNIIESNTKTTAIYGYGMCFNNDFLSNTVTYVGDGTQAQGNLPLAGIAFASVNGINPAGSATGVRKAPSMRNRIGYSSTYNCGIQMNMVAYGNAIPYRSYGNRVENSTVIGSSIVYDYNEDNIATNNYASQGIQVKNAPKSRRTGSLAGQDSSSVNITGGKISGVTLAAQGVNAPLNHLENYSAMYSSRNLVDKAYVDAGFLKRKGVVDPDQVFSSGHFLVAGTNANNPFAPVGARGFASVEGNGKQGWMMLGKNSNASILKIRLLSNGVWEPWKDLETRNNRTISINTSSTDSQYPTALAVKKYVDGARATAAYSAGTIASGSRVSQVLPVLASLGQYAQASFSANLQNVKMWAEVTAANQVTVYFENNTGSEKTPSGTITVRVNP